MSGLLNIFGGQKYDCYVGWLYADEWEVGKLKGMGVTGPMIWTPGSGRVYKALGKTGAIEKCLCDNKTLDRLVAEYKEMWKTYCLDSDQKVTPYPRTQFSPYSYERAKKEWGWTE